MFVLSVPLLGQTTLVRNNDIVILDPLTPPLETLFDAGTGALTGQLLLQPYHLIAYAEDLDQPSDGPLVFYRLDIMD